MEPKLIALFLFLFYFVSANQDFELDKVSCRNEGCYHKFKRCPGGDIVANENKTTIGHANFRENPPSFDIYKTFAGCMNESGIVINYGSNISIGYHNCNGVLDDSTDFYCTHDTSMNGALRTSSKPNVTHPIANDTSKNVMVGVGVGVVVMVMVMVVVLCIRKCKRKGKPDNHEGNNIEMEPLQVVVEPDQAAYA